MSNLTGRKWTQAEKELLFTDAPNSEIAAAIGRTETAVGKMRYILTGAHVEKERSQGPHFVGKPDRGLYSEEYKILRIKNLAKKLGVRILED